MPVNLKEFNAKVGRFTSRLLPEQIQLVKQKVALQLLERIVNMTPVDTGRARSNWQVTLDERSTSVTGPIVSAAQTINTGAAVIAAVSGGQSIWIANNLPYIEPLENGHSSQAPAGMIAVALAEVGSQFG